MTTTQPTPPARLPRQQPPAPGRDAHTAPGLDASRSGTPPWLIVATREIVVRATNRAFIISTLLTLALIAGFGAFSLWQSSRTTTYTVAVSAPEGARLVSDAAATARQDDDTVAIEARTVAGEPAARALVEGGDAAAWLHAGGEGWTLTSADEVPLGLRTAVESAVRSAALETNAASAGTSVDALERGTTVAVARFDGEAIDAGFVQVATIAFALLFLMAAMLFGQQIAASVVEEKQSRLVEIIATAIPLRHLLAGKVGGNSVIALGQVVLFAAVGLVAVSFSEWSTLLPALSTAVVWFVLYFIVGFFALACLFAVAGALASRMEDLQSTTAPLTTALMLVYFASFGLSGTAAVIASYVPIASVVSMPARILAGETAWWEPILSLGIMAAFAAVTVVIGERIYRRSLLQTRGRLSWREAYTAPE